MTTTVTIDAHAGWDVEVTKVLLDVDGNETSRETVVVNKHTKVNFYIHSNMKLVEVKELKFN